MTGNNNTYYKSSMYEDRGENTAQEMVDTVIMMAVAAVDM